MYPSFFETSNMQMAEADGSLPSATWPQQCVKFCAGAQGDSCVLNALNGNCYALHNSYEAPLTASTGQTTYRRPTAPSPSPSPPPAPSTKPKPPTPSPKPSGGGDDGTIPLDPDCDAITCNLGGFVGCTPGTTYSGLEGEDLVSLGAMPTMLGSAAMIKCYGASAPTTPLSLDTLYIGTTFTCPSPNPASVPIKVCNACGRCTYVPTITVCNPLNTPSIACSTKSVTCTPGDILTAAGTFGCRASNGAALELSNKDTYTCKSSVSKQFMVVSATADASGCMSLTNILVTAKAKL